MRGVARREVDDERLTGCQVRRLTNGVRASRSGILDERRAAYMLASFKAGLGSAVPTLKHEI